MPIKSYHALLISGHIDKIGSLLCMLHHFEMLSLSRSKDCIDVAEINRVIPGGINWTLIK